MESNDVGMGFKVLHSKVLVQLLKKVHLQDDIADETIA